MAKLYFKYGTMDAAKSAELIMIAHKYISQGKRVLALKSNVDTRHLENDLAHIDCLIESRAFTDKLSALVIPNEESLYNTLDYLITKTGVKSNIFYDKGVLKNYTQQTEMYPLLGNIKMVGNKIINVDDSVEALTEKEVLPSQTVILVDEAQFLRKEQVKDLTKIVDDLHIPVICFGLKNTYLDGVMFEGASALLYYADECSEIKSVCQFCQAKATMHLYIENNTPVYKTEGEQSGIKVGDVKGLDSYYISTCRHHYFNPPSLVEDLTPREILIGEVYRHFKGKHYLVLEIAENTETKEKMVIYKALYGDMKIYARPLDMFSSKVDKIKYPDSQQEYRFELENDFKLR